MAMNQWHQYVALISNGGSESRERENGGNGSKRISEMKLWLQPQ